MDFTMGDVGATEKRTDNLMGWRLGYQQRAEVREKVHQERVEQYGEEAELGGEG